MGGSSSSRSDTTTTNTTQVTDRRTVADNGAVVLGDGATATVTQTDFGAISGAMDIAKSAGDIAKVSVVGATAVATAANESAGKTAVSAFDFAGQAGKAAIAASNSALTTVKEAYQDSQDTAAGNRTIAFVGLTIAGVLAVTIAMKAR